MCGMMKHLGMVGMATVGRDGLVLTFTEGRGYRHSQNQSLCYQLSLEQMFSIISSSFKEQSRGCERGEMDDIKAP